MVLPRGAKWQDGREVRRRVRGVIGEKPGVGGWGGCSLWVLSGGVDTEALVKHSCRVVWSDPPLWTVHRRLISSSTEQGSKGELAALGGPRQAPSYRSGIDMVPWGLSGAGGGGGDEATRWVRREEEAQRRLTRERLTHWDCLWKRQLIDNWE